MGSEQAAVELIDLIYDAAVNATRWPAFLERLGRHVHATATNIFAQDLRTEEVHIAGAVGTDTSYQRSYETYYKTKNVFLTHGDRLLRTGNVYPSEALCPDQLALRSEFYNDWIAPQKQRHGMLGVILRETSISSVIGAIRPPRASPFGKDEVSLMHVLIPHLQRAIVLDRRIAYLERQNAAASDALDRWALGLIILDHKGHVMLTNRRADEIVRQGDGVAVSADGVRTSVPRETVALRALILGAIKKGSNGSLPGGALTVSRPSSKRPFTLFVAPACAHKRLFSVNGAAAVVFVGDPETRENTNEELIRHLYKLTPAESRLLALLLAETDLKRVAERMHIRMNTARTHLKRIFEKTGTKRQAELVGLLLRGPAQVLT
jgi:DNA-binding CsgD family transcriptional regulator